MKRFIVEAELKIPEEDDVILAEGEGGLVVATEDWSWDFRYVATDIYPLTDVYPGGDE